MASLRKIIESLLISRLRWILLALIPLVLLTSAMLYVYVQQQDRAIRHLVIQAASGISSVVERTLSEQIGLLESLSVYRSLDNGNFDAFRSEAQRLWDRHPEWRTIILTDRFQPVFNIRFAPGEPITPLRDPRSLKIVWETKKPYVGDLARGYVAIRVPVTRNQAMRYTLVAPTNPDIFKKALQASREGDHWDFMIIGSDGVVIAASGGAASPAGEALDQPFRQNRDSILSSSGMLYSPPLAVASAAWRVIAFGSEASITLPYRKERMVVITVCVLSILLAAVLIYLSGSAWAKRQETETLIRQEEKYRQLFGSMSEGFALHEIITDAHGRPCDFRFLEANPACERMLGLSRAEMTGRRMTDMTPELPWIERYEKVALTGESIHFEEYSPGLSKWFEVFAFRPEPGQCAAVFTDFTERKQMETALKDSEAHLRTLIRTIPDLVWLKDQDGVFLACNSRFEDLFGTKERDIIGKTDYDFLEKETADFFREHDRLAMERGRPSKNEEEVTFEADGHKEILETIKTPIYDGNGKITGILGIGRDITERKQAEIELKNRERLLNELGSIAKIGGWEHDLLTGKAAWTREIYNIVGIDVSDGIPGVEEHYDYYPPAERAVLKKAYDHAVSTGERFDLELQCKNSKGQLLWVRVIGRPEFKDGKCVKMQGTFQDISERKKMEHQILQTQKMESVGQLAGGVAHDFNNMLSLILGNAELGMDKVTPDDPLHEHLQEIYSAGKRSAKITRQLLAFARKQAIQPRVLDLNKTVENMLKMLQRLIGEDIDLAWKPGTDIGTVRIDPYQVDQILVNLCINAQDAIGGVGKVTIETHNVSFDEDYCGDHPGFKPGDFVMLGVSDDGSGMDKEILDKVFEPFFTTKKVGEGTGLGLATVYGIVKQNDGFINVYSEPGRGTTFRIYFVRQMDLPESPEPVPQKDLPIGRGETILLVEDEEPILKLGQRMLRDLGYHVLSARTPSEAIYLSSEQEKTIHLLLTDVVMPEMNGSQLADLIRLRFPDINVLFMSGYTANVIAHRGILDTGVRFLSKPFSRKDLALKVRETLDKDRDPENEPK